MYISTDLETVVDKMHHSLHHTSIKDIDMDMLEWKLGLRITYGGPYTYAHGRTINIHHVSKEEAYFAFAHEFCHILMDGGLQWWFPDLYIEYTERKTNLFAAYFCVPTFLLKQCDLPLYTHEAALLVAEEFGVPYRVAKFRVKQYRTRKCQSLGFIR